MRGYNEFLAKVRGKRCAVLGLGVSNLPLAKLLISPSVGATVTVYDKKDVSELGAEALSLADSGVKFVVGFENIVGDIIFRSPGIRPDIDGIQRAMSSGAELMSEMEAFLAYSPAKLFGITGSDGKTTTTTLCGLFLESAGRTYTGGNIGTPLLDRIGEMSESDSAVLELSSFQLMTVKRAPMCSAITNISPNHMDWHTSEDEYAKAKYNIVGEETRRAVLNADSERTYAFGKELLAKGGREVIFFSRTKSPRDIPPGAGLMYLENNCITYFDGISSTALLDTGRILLPGGHNVENYMTAMALTYGYVDAEIYGRVAESFGGVEHRLELVRSLAGVDYYNSSIDSSPTRTAAALSALKGRDIVVICGGYDKKLSYGPLAESLCENVRAVVLTGATGPKIKQALLDFGGYDPKVLSIVEAESFEDAVYKARELSAAGGCVLLSPASASFDRFKNFAERGRYFKELVKGL